MSITHAMISDYTKCPHCVAQGWGGFADCYYNTADQLWAVCSRHSVRWFVTRALLRRGLPELPSHPPDLALVKAIPA